MKTYPLHFQKLFCEPLMVLESTRITFERALLQRMGLVPTAMPAAPVLVGTDLEPRAETPAQRKQRRVNGVMQTFGQVAVITIDGVIDKRLSDYELDCFGGVDLNDIDAAITQAHEDPRIETVVFDFNSPGGSVTGVPETAARIKQLGNFKNAGGAAKETRARVEALCGSAAYYLASQCDTIDAAPSAVLGSIGVYCAFMDESRALEMQGYKVELIKAGAFKAMGASFKPLSDEERGMMQAEVDRLWSEFKGAVSGSRPGVPASAMEGQTFRGELAKKNDLCDALDPSSLDEYVAGLLTR
jgi:signal peptide peptidase SppA